MTIINGDTGIDKVQSGVIADEDLVNAPYKMVTMTAVTASGTAVDITGIPSWAKRITIMFDNLSTNGNAVPVIQFGALGIQTSGYKANGATFGNGAYCSISAQATNWFPLGNSSASGDTRSGKFILTLMSGSIWAGIAEMSLNSQNIMLSTGTVTLSGILDRVRITTTNNTDVFDAGTINVMYEG